MISMMNTILSPPDRLYSYLNICLMKIIYYFLLFFEENQVRFIHTMAEKVTITKWSNSKVIEKSKSLRVDTKK